MKKRIFFSDPSGTWTNENVIKYVSDKCLKFRAQETEKGYITQTYHICRALHSLNKGCASGEARSAHPLLLIHVV